MFDTHTHICHKRFTEDRERVFERARNVGVSLMLEVGWDLRSSEQAIRFAEIHDGVWVAVGYHPHDSKDAPENYLERLAELCKHEKVKAVGEIGLDFYRDLSPRDVQRRVFVEQMELAESVRLPIVIHTREAMDETIRMVEESGYFWGVFHSLSADSNQVDRILELGFYLGLNGTITYDAQRTRRCLANTPGERLLVETDCPYLTPEPHRRERNEPAYVRYVVEKVADVLGETAEAIAVLTERNGRELFLA
jgi:TatD DNase family protein